MSRLSGTTTVASAANTVSVVARPALNRVRRRLWTGVNKYATMAAITTRIR